VKQCTCTSSIITRYQKRISGPLLDRIDIHVEVPRVEYEKLSDNRAGETSHAIRARVEAARRRQRERVAGVEEVTCNSEMRPTDVREHCKLGAAGQSLTKAAIRQLVMHLNGHPQADSSIVPYVAETGSAHRAAVTTSRNGK
jgi:magnesium chelatase family protein